MKVGQRVRFKSTSAARYWKIPQDAQGTVMCSYETPNEQSCQGGPIGCAHYTAISDLGRGR